MRVGTSGDDISYLLPFHSPTELVQFGAPRLPAKFQSSLNLIPSQWGGFPRVSMFALSVSVFRLLGLSQ